jgi:endogenous inhibitor of DNA gyrase (YacG/DUF329 family)
MTETQNTGSPCPICKKPAQKAYRPFCSKRCADADLGKWFSGAYAVPGEPVDPEALPPQDRSGDDA